MNYTKIKYISVGLLLFCLTSLFSQPTDDDKNEKPDPTFQSVKKDKNIKKGYFVQLHEGTLIFRLAMYGKKTKQLEKLLASDDISPKFRAQIQEELKETNTKRQKENQALIESLKRIYTFSDVYFVPDSLAGKLKTGEWNGIFLNEKMELDPTIKVEQKKEVFMGYIYTTAGDNKFIRVATIDNVPFGSVKMYNFWELMNYTGDESKFIPKAISRLEKYLHRNYNKIIEENRYIIEE